MKKFVTENVEGQKYNGGLPIVWDDLLYVQSALAESIANIAKSVANSNSAFIISGCTTRRWVGYQGGAGQYVDFRLTQGVLCLNGEICDFAGFENLNIPSGNVIWAAIDTQYSATEGIKVIEATQSAVPCYSIRRAVVQHAADYPVGVAGVNYFPLEKHATDERPAIDYLYEILQENLQKKSQQLTATALLNWNVTNVLIAQNGNVAHVCGVVTCGGGAGQSGTAIIQMPFSALTKNNKYYNFTATWEDNLGNKIQDVKMWVAGNKIYVDGIEITVGQQIAFGVTFIIA